MELHKIMMDYIAQLVRFTISLLWHSTLFLAAWILCIVVMGPVLIFIIYAVIRLFIVEVLQRWHQS